MFCNIEKNDNLFRHMSTFQLEMSEIRVIMNTADEHSLVLGDEWMNSTELPSGLTIMMSVLDTLCAKKASFVIASHFNQLNDYEEIQTLVQRGTLGLKHMSVSFDQEHQRLVYDRILKDGLGSRSYGLEVARSMHLGSAFLDHAFALRNKYFPECRGVLSLPTSKYNTQKLRGICEQCGQNLGTEIHHRLEQHQADDAGFIGHVHKNHPANLMSVCENCHRKIHQS